MKIVPNKTNMIKYIIFYLLIIIILFFISMVFFNNIEKKSFYEIGGTQVQSIYKVVGERKISKVSQYQSNSVWNKEYKYYGVTSPKDDIEKYVKYMVEEQAFNCDDEIDKNEKSGEIVLYKNASNTEGYIEILIKYYDNRYDICLKVGQSGDGSMIYKKSVTQRTVLCVDRIIEKIL